MPTLYGSFCRVDLADGVLVAMADSTTVRVVPTPDASTRAVLAADVARLERAVADLTRECGRLRAQLEAAHRAACEGVDLGAWVRRSDVLRLCEREALRLQGRRFFAEAESVRRLGALVGDLRSEDVEGGEQEGVEGVEDHRASVAPATGCRESRGGQSS